MTSRLPDAIRNHRVVEFSYRGRSHAVEPHAFGYDAAGDLTLAGWQLSGKQEGFRAFQVSSMRLLTVSARRFPGPRPDYDRRRAGMRRIVCEL